jgi:tRNA(Ile)-lysidine synthase
MPSSSLVERYRADLAALGGASRPLVAVSGGADSLALLLLAAPAGGTVTAATVDHGLRAEAASEATFVAGVCAGLGVPHAVLTPSEPLAKAGSIQARARAARYDRLVEHARACGCDAILTGHHLDDQAETFLMRASRGAGADGLTGVRSRGAWSGLPVLRPLLGWRRSELAELVNAAGLDPVCDPTNADPAYDRSRVRALLAHSDDLSPTGLARSAATLGDASEALRWTVETLLADRISETGGGLSIDPSGLPREYRRRLLLTALARHGADSVRGPAADRLMAELDAGRSASAGDLLVTPDKGEWRVGRAPPRRA